MREYDESEFRDMSFEEFEELIKQNEEIEIPFEDFMAFVEEVSGGGDEAADDYEKSMLAAELLAHQGKCKAAFEIAHKMSNRLPQKYWGRLIGLYEICSEHGVLGASVAMADLFFDRTTNEERGEAFKYLERLYRAGFLPYYWKLGYCYLKGVGTDCNKEKAKEIFLEGLLFYRDSMCRGHLRNLIPYVDDACEEGVKYYYGKGCSQDYRRAYDLFINELIHSCSYEGYCYMRIADVLNNSRVVNSSPRRVFLLYKNAFKEGCYWVPEEDDDCDEDEIYYKLGKCFFDGYGVEKDYYIAAELLRYARGVFDDEEKEAEIENMMNEASEKAEALSNDEDMGDYYMDSFKNGSWLEDFDYDTPDDAFLYL